MNAKIMGTGYELPAFRADNDYLATLVDTSDEWIRERTGICARHLAKEETTTSMAAKAARKALRKAGVDASEVELVIVATITEIRIHRVRPAKYRHRLAQTMRWHLI